MRSAGSAETAAGTNSNLLPRQKRISSDGGRGGRSRSSLRPRSRRFSLVKAPMVASSVCSPQSFRSRASTVRSIARRSQRAGAVVERHAAAISIASPIEAHRHRLDARGEDGVRMPTNPGATRGRTAKRRHVENHARRRGVQRLHDDGRQGAHRATEQGEEVEGRVGQDARRGHHGLQTRLRQGGAPPAARPRACPRCGMAERTCLGLAVQGARLEQLKDKVSDLCDLQPTPVSMLRPSQKEARPAHPAALRSHQRCWPWPKSAPSLTSGAQRPALPARPGARGRGV